MADSQSTVTYRELADFPGYRVGDDGSVWSRRDHGRLLTDWHRIRPNPNGAENGYLTVMLYPGAKRRHIHRLILLAFVGPCPPGMECCHWDGDRHNNALINLRWGTRAENNSDRARHGRVLSGERHPHAKLTTDQVLTIREAFAKGTATVGQLAKMYGVRHTAISRVVGRTRWKHV